MPSLDIIRGCPHWKSKTNAPFEMSFGIFLVGKWGFLLWNVSLKEND